MHRKSPRDVQLATLPQPPLSEQAGWLALTDFLALAILVARTRNLALVSAGQILDVHVGPIDPAGNILLIDGNVRVVRQDFRLVGILQWLSCFRAALNVLVVAVASLTPNIELRQNAH